MSASASEPLDSGHRLRTIARLAGRRDGAAARVQDQFQQRRARDAVGQRVMHAHDQRALPVLQSFHDADVPQRLAAVHHLRQNPAGERLQFRLTSRGFHRHAEDVAADIEVGVILPRGIPEMELRVGYHLAVTRQQMQLRVDRLHEFGEGYGTIENTNAGYV